MLVPGRGLPRRRRSHCYDSVLYASFTRFSLSHHEFLTKLLSPIAFRN